jgi:hypothetical protein
MEFALSIFLDDPDFFLREVVEVVNEAVDPAVRGVHMTEVQKRQDASAICFTPVPNAHDLDDFFFFVKLVDNSI